MRIGINAVYFRPHQQGGTETYLRNVVRGLLEVDSRNEYLLIVTPQCDGLIEGERQSIQQLTYRLPAWGRALRVAWEQLMLPFLTSRMGADVLFCPAFVGPVRSPIPTVVTIHDLHYRYHPENFSRAHLEYFRWFIPASASRCRHIITISQYSKNDIVRLLGVAEEKVSVIYLGVDTEKFTVATDDAQALIRQKYSPEAPYILTVSRFDRSKNIPRLLKAFRTLCQRDGIPHTLVVAGITLGRDRRLKKIVDELGLASKVRIVGFVPGAELPGLYSAADLFVFPSLFEGFGLPVLEAMSCGCPVVASNAASLPEVVGDAGLLFDPLSTEEMAAAMFRVLSEPPCRSQLVKKSLAQARQFNWKTTAEQTLQVLERAAGA